MDTQSRGRSPSAGRQNDINRHTPSPSPHRSYQPDPPGLGLDQSLLGDPSAFNNFNGQYNSNPQAPFDLSAQFAGNQQQFPQQADVRNHTFLQAQGQSGPSFGQQGDNYPGALADWNNTSRNSGNFDQQLFPGNNGSQDFGFGGGSLDPKVLESQDQDQSINPSSLMNPMGSLHQQTPTPPHLLQTPEMQRQLSGSPHASPNLSQGAFPSAGHSRNTSLDPSSAAYPMGQTQEWGGMQFRGHRRSPSDTYSEVSSSHPSPYLGNADTFEPGDQPSPLLGAQQDPAMFGNIVNMDQFSISNSHQHISPSHTPNMSPNLMPQQQALPPFTSSDNFGLSAQMNNNYGGPNGMDMFPNQGQEPFPQMQQENASGEFGDQMSPPEINIQLAPPSRQASFEPAKPEQSIEGGLSPPSRGRRVRAKSDPYHSSTRASTPATSNDSLSPNVAAGRHSRSPSPAGKSSRRSSTSSIPNRDYILDLADPSRSPGPPNGAGAGSPGDTGATGAKRTQKHPATFQCSLCPKRFTRAYNLRSHLRTHTDERPFVCSVCGKAFARQHDRKRHEGLHSGEKKFVCRGVLKDNGSWGCGRRFARADALGRHFRSEAGRVCIKPLLEEEAAEKGWDQPNADPNMDPSAAGMMGQQMMPGMMAPPGFDPSAQMYPQPGMDPMAARPQFYLPQALLAQHPALANIQWESMPAGGGGDDDVEGRSSFDASSGGEMFDDEETTAFGRPSFGWASDSGF